MHVSIFFDVGVGVTGPESSEGGPLPTRFHASTEQVYVAPLVSPGTTIGLSPATAEPLLPLDDWHVAR